MLRKEDLEILSHLLDELKETRNVGRIYAANMPDWYKNIFVKNKTQEEYDLLEIEFRRLAGIFQSQNMGSYAIHKTGFAQIHATEKTYRSNFTDLYKEQNEEQYQKKVEFEVKKTGLKLNKWLLKTRWLPHIVAGTSIIISIYSFFYNQSKFETEVNELEDRIEMLEKMNVLEENI